MSYVSKKRQIYVYDIYSFAIHQDSLYIYRNKITFDMIKKDMTNRLITTYTNITATTIIIIINNSL